VEVAVHRELADCIDARGVRRALEMRSVEGALVDPGPATMTATLGSDSNLVA
jgi:hypothetical protein